MKSISIATALAYAGGVSAFWRMPCRSQTGVARLDPLVNPGGISDHVHTITGGGGFGPITNYKSLTSSNCTGCAVTQDHSAYWTPTLYFHYSNGTAVMVPQVGGMLAYYLYYLDNVKAFPEGFAMIAGNPAYRNFTGPFPDTPLSFWPTDPTDQFFLQQRALGFNCLDYSKTPEASLYRHQFPEKAYMDANCVDGLRLELAFPSCGKEGVLDSPDHRSHVAYPSLVKEGNCPDGFDVHYPFLFFETIWATQNFAGEDGQFLLATGDPIGTSYHGDFIMGWESESFLQSALDTCTDASGEISDCPLFKIQDDDVAAECKFDMPNNVKNDDNFGPRNGLPVDVPIQYGPAQATKYPIAGASGVPTTSLAQSSPPATFTSQPQLPYSPVQQASGSLELGIGEKAKNIVPTLSVPVAAPSSQVTSAAVSAAASAAVSASSSDSEVSVKWMTTGDKVIKLIMEATDVTVFATPSATVTAHAEAHKRHAQMHQHHARH